MQRALDRIPVPRQEQAPEAPEAPYPVETTLPLRPVGRLSEQIAQIRQSVAAEQERQQARERSRSTAAPRHPYGYD